MPSPYVTEAYLQKQVEQHAALQIGRVMLDLAFGYGPDIAHVVGAYADPDYVKNGRFNVSCALEGQAVAGRQAGLRA